MREQLSRMKQEARIEAGIYRGQWTPAYAGVTNQETSN